MFLEYLSSRLVWFSLTIWILGGVGFKNEKRMKNMCPFDFSHIFVFFDQVLLSSLVLTSKQWKDSVYQTSYFSELKIIGGEKNRIAPISLRCGIFIQPESLWLSEVVILELLGFVLQIFLNDFLYAFELLSLSTLLGRLSLYDLSLSIPCVFLSSS